MASPCWEPSGFCIFSLACLRQREPRLAQTGASVTGIAGTVATSPSAGRAGVTMAPGKTSMHCRTQMLCVQYSTCGTSAAPFRRPCWASTPARGLLPGAARSAVLGPAAIVQVCIAFSWCLCLCLWPVLAACGQAYLSSLTWRAGQPSIPAP